MGLFTSRKKLAEMKVQGNYHHIVITEIIFICWFWLCFFVLYCCPLLFFCYILTSLCSYMFPCLMCRSSYEILSFQILNARFPLSLSSIAPGLLQNTTRSSLNIRVNGHILKPWSFFSNIQHFIWISWAVLKLVLTAGLYRQNTSVREQRWWDLE